MKFIKDKIFGRQMRGRIQIVQPQCRFSTSVLRWIAPEYVTYSRFSIRTQRRLLYAELSEDDLDRCRAPP
ncbi:hypothetical protein GDO81_006872 [Engystomops pustulosus]|uniref:Uncharacterized protein n=1 Tax=Engystomops pustulosus TaxID=76066 RepID=A0AAV7D0N8_ENGPU|nr:hypothetical protein GDO81_006872 [Engystomops pustulosus]